MAERHLGRSLQGPIALLCNVRLASLALATLVLASGSQTHWVELVVLLAALPFSFRPLRRAARGPVVQVSAAFAAADVLVMLAVLVVAGLDSLALGYVAASLIVSSLWRGRVTTLCALVALFALHLVALAEGAATSGQQAFDVLARLLLFAAVAYAGVRLRELLLSSEQLAEQVQADGVRAAAEAERSRLAREMHDSLSKTLHGTHLLATVLADRLAREGSGAAEEVHVIAQAVDSARQDARRLLVELRQDPVEDLGAHLRRLATCWASSWPGELHLELPPTEPLLTAAAREELSRAVGELLENVTRHSRAALVEVRLRVVAGSLETVVRDDGVGMSNPDLTALYRAGHFGLIGVRERMARIGGTLEVRAADPTGTEVVLMAPLVGTPLTAANAAPVTGVVPLHPTFPADLVR